MGNEIYNGSLESQGIEVLMSIQVNERQYQVKLDALKLEIQKIEKAYRKRIDVIETNVDRYEQSKVVDQLRDARINAKNSLDDLVNSKGWKKAIQTCREELETYDPGSELKQLQTTLLEIEARACIADGRMDPAELQGQIKDVGSPLWVQAVRNSPVPVAGVTEQMMEDGIALRLEKLKPVLAEKYHSLLRVQANLEAAASLFIHLESDDIDPLADILDAAMG